MIDYEILEKFVTFYQTGTLRETAEKKHISQPTLTRNMQKLEAEFGVPLFNRTKNSIALNETGILAAEDAQMLLKQTENMLQRAREFDRKNRTIMLGACTPVYVPELIHRITAVYPAAAISSEVNKVSSLLEGIRDGRYHAVLLPFCPEDDDLSCRKWGEEHLSFLLPKRHRFARRKSLSVSEMNGENMLLFQDIGFWHDLVVEKMPDSRFLVQTERYTFKELIENSTMPVFTTDYSFDSFPASIAVGSRVAVPIIDPEFNVSYYLVCKKNLSNLLQFYFRRSPAPDTGSHKY